MSQLLKLSPSQWQLSGEFNRQTLPGLWSELTLLPKSGKLTIDLSKLARVDSAGLAGLLRLKTNADHLSVELSYLNAPEQIRHLAQMSNVANMLSLS